MIYPEAAQLKLQFEFWILCRSLAVLCREYYFLNIKTCRPAPRQGNEIFFRDSQLNCCFGISTESCARISGQGQPICWCLPSHSPASTIPSSHKLNYISSRFLSLWRNWKARMEDSRSVQPIIVNQWQGRHQPVKLIRNGIVSPCISVQVRALWLVGCWQSKGLVW